MDDFLFELLGMILEPIVDAIFTYVFGGLLDLLLRALGKIFKAAKIESPPLAAFGYVLFGLLAGAISIIFFPYRIVRRSRVPGTSLVVSPLIVGLLMSLTGLILRRNNKRVIRLETFWYGFAFALGMALWRFWMARP